jgi:hypothetical protein
MTICAPSVATAVHGRQRRLLDTCELLVFVALQLSERPASHVARLSDVGVEGSRCRAAESVTGGALCVVHADDCRLQRLEMKLRYPGPVSGTGLPGTELGAVSDVFFLDDEVC